MARRDERPNELIPAVGFHTELNPFCWEKENEMKRNAILTLVVAFFGLASCSSDQVIDNTVDVVGGGTKFVAKGVVGAGKLVYRGVAGADEE